MKIDVVRLGDQKEISLTEEWDAQGYDLNAPGWSYCGPVHVTATVKRDAGVIAADVAVQAERTCICTRCQKEFRQPLEEQFHFVYPFDPTVRTLVLDEDIREEMILGYPQKILCRQDCRGLCCRCGADLNEEKCKCGAER